MLSDRSLIADTINKLRPDIAVTEKGNIKLTVMVNDATIEGEAYGFETAALILKTRYERHVKEWANNAGMTQNEGIS